VNAAIIAAVAVLAPAGLAHADQCQWLDDPAIATRAARELAGHPEIIAFCEPCGDLAPGAPHTARSVVTQPLRDRAVSLVVDGDSVDLAYLYVKTSAHQYRNLAALAGCPTRDVSPSLRVEAATADGVLIHADHAAMAPSAPPVIAAPPPAVSATPRAVTAPPTTIVIVASAPPSLALLILGGGATLAILGSLALWLAARRRPRHVPRATRLEPPR
jgi:hypothetical protein